jgi:hypothetical protein
VSTRKKWRLFLIPSFRYQGEASMKGAYESVARYREQYAEGRSRVHQVTVEVNEGNGWQLYERCVFPTPGEEPK